MRIIGAAISIFRAALLFGASGVVGSYLGSYLTHLFSDRLLLAGFAALMVIVGFAMLRQRPAPEGETRCSVGPCLLVGFIVGGLTGFLGVGGGFLIVPALILFAALPTQKAVGTSLAIITLSAAAGLLGQLQKTSVDWATALKFGMPAVLGLFGGFIVADKVSGHKLQKAFGWFIIVLGLLIGGLTGTGLSVTSRAS